MKPLGWYPCQPSQVQYNYTINGVPLSGPPVPPQSFAVAKSANNHPNLTWTANTDPDLVGYKVYKYLNAEVGWQYLATTTSTSYEDLSEYSISELMAFDHDISYKVTAIDNQSLESPASDPISIRVIGVALDKKRNNELAATIPTEYKLQQNYPNPFNPSSRISYQIPQKGLVQLNVYDMTGHEVESLVNRLQDAGEYSVTFDANKLSSGIYLYSLRVNDFVSYRKMSLIK